MINRKNKLLSLVLLVVIQIIYSQNLEQNKVKAFANMLNTTLATKFKVALKNNKAYCNIDQLAKTLDLRDNAAMAKESLKKDVKTKLHRGPYTGHVYWKYIFDSTSSSAVRFNATKSKQLCCEILFDVKDVILIKSQLNAFTSHHRTSDSSMHTVEWAGEKCISLLLSPQWHGEQLELSVEGITLSGTFQRKDNQELAKNYRKSLQSIFKREFKTVFESESMMQLLIATYKSLHTD